MTITIHNVYDEELAGQSADTMTFPGGEPHAKLSNVSIFGKYIWVDARVGTADEFMRLLAVLDAAKAMRPKRLGLFLPYFPGARQDRREVGTPLTVKLYADAINRLGLDYVLTYDPHSDVVMALLDRAEAVPQHAPFVSLGQSYHAIMCPDAGAAKRVHTTATAFGIAQIVYGRKLRDPATGKLSGFRVDDVGLLGEHRAVNPKLLVVDDICDGGGTFVGLAEAMDSRARLDLLVSHGIFSKGLDAIRRRYSLVFTTDSFPMCHVTRRDAILRVSPLAPLARQYMNRSLA